MFKKFYDQGDIYKGAYEGMYCTPCESFWTESQLVDGKCPDCGRPVQKASEEAYFFKLSKYSQKLLDLYDEHPEFLQEIVPEIFYENQTEKEPTLLLTMPPVNKDRRDLLLKGVDGLYNDTKAKFERLKAICVNELTVNLSENPTMLDEAKEALEKEYEKKKELLEQYKQKKIDEIEEAYRRYEANRQTQDAGKNGQNNNMSAEDNEAMNSMKLDSWKDY